jgi:acetate kinase
MILALNVGSASSKFALHADQPRPARLYGLRRKLTEQGIIGHGFHGLSYAYIASVPRQRYGGGAGGAVRVSVTAFTGRHKIRCRI